MKPGLWEINNKLKSKDGQVEKAMSLVQSYMDGMPPEQRKALEAKVAQQGFTMPAMTANGGILAKMCVTKEMVARNFVPVQSAGNCTVTQKPISSSVMKVSFRCTAPESSGDGEMRFHGDSAYSMTMRMTSNAAGAMQAADMESTGNWIGADCGSVKPATPHRVE
ncbi:DUF3617 domain-containing protein [Massilia cavernae]|nr:DUF3617 domain-containing protein [Massilia cavernae]